MNFHLQMNSDSRPTHQHASTHTHKQKNKLIGLFLIGMSNAWMAFKWLWWPLISRHLAEDCQMMYSTVLATSCGILSTIVCVCVCV